MNQRLNIHAVRISLCAGRSLQDWSDGLAYSLYLINRGRIGSRAEREYIDSERAARQYRVLASSIQDYKFEEDDDAVEDDEVAVLAVVDGGEDTGRVGEAC